MLSWSNRRDRRRDDEPGDLPDPTGNLPVVALGFDPATGYVTVRLAREVLPFAAPDHVQDDDVIEPAQVFKPWLSYRTWEDAEDD